jgi:hypothetical protein
MLRQFVMATGGEVGVERLIRYRRRAGDETEQQDGS